MSDYSAPGVVRCVGLFPGCPSVPINPRVPRAASSYRTTTTAIHVVTSRWLDGASGSVRRVEPGAPLVPSSASHPLRLYPHIPRSCLLATSTILRTPTRSHFETELTHVRAPTALLRVNCKRPAIFRRVIGAVDVILLSRSPYVTRCENWRFTHPSRVRSIFGRCVIKYFTMLA